MASARDLKNTSDPSDWRGEVSFLRDLDESLRCELCYDIFEAPVSFKTCGHSFCSRCIRQHINQPGQAGRFCPKCRQPKANDSELLPQPALESAALAWKSSRAALTKVFATQAKREMSLEKRTEELTKRSDSHSDRASASTHVDSLTSEGHISHKKREKRKADSALNGVQYNRPSPRERGSSRRDRRGSNERYESGEAEITHSEASPSSETIQDGDDPTGSKRSLRARKARKLDDGRRSIYGEIPPAHDGAEDGASSDGFEIVEEEVAEKPSAKLEAQSEFDCPICQWSFTLIALNRHLDKGCSETDPEPSLAERGIESKRSEDAAALNGNGHLSAKAKNKNPQMWFTRRGEAPESSSSSSLQHKSSSVETPLKGVGGSTSRAASIDPKGKAHQSRTTPSINGTGRNSERAEATTAHPVSRQTQPSEEPKRLIRPVYHLKKDRDLKGLLTEFELSTVGTKEKLVDRHSQWINLYNGNLDASEANRKSNSQLKKELEAWERTQSSSNARSGGGSNSNKASVTDKISEQQLNSWVRDHREHFTDLTKMAIKTALKNRRVKSAETKTAGAEAPEKTLDAAAQEPPQEPEHRADADGEEPTRAHGAGVRVAGAVGDLTHEKDEFPGFPALPADWNY